MISLPAFSPDLPPPCIPSIDPPYNQMADLILRCEFKRMIVCGVIAREAILSKIDRSTKEEVGLQHGFTQAKRVIKTTNNRLIFTEVHPQVLLPYCISPRVALRYAHDYDAVIQAVAASLGYPLNHAAPSPCHDLVKALVGDQPLDSNRQGKAKWEIAYDIRVIEKFTGEEAEWDSLPDFIIKYLNSKGFYSLTDFRKENWKPSTSKALKWGLHTVVCYYLAMNGR